MMATLFTIFIGLLHAATSSVADVSLSTNPASIAQPSLAVNERGFISAAYFTNWAIYARGHTPQDMPIDKLTHVFYAFANIRSDGQVYLTDEWADVQKHFEADSWNESNATARAYGCINQINKMKKSNRNLKALLSIGGWTYSANFEGPASSTTGRRRLAKSAIKLMQDIGFDGIDIDWEYPTDDNQARNLVSLLQELRSELESRSNSDTTYLLTVASPAGPSKYSLLHLAAMDQYLDYWNLMAYDYAGSWDQISGHSANLYQSSEYPHATPFNTDEAVSAYIKAGVPAHKIVLGMPLYGRAFGGTDGPGTRFSSIPAGHWERGVYDYKDLPFAGAEIREDLNLGASWSYDSARHIMVSYDTPNIVKMKAKYIQSKGLGGGFFWETSGDRSGEGSLISTLVDSFGGLCALQESQNHIQYPDSKYDNIRK